MKFFPVERGIIQVAALKVYLEAEFLGIGEVYAKQLAVPEQAVLDQAARGFQVAQVTVYKMTIPEHRSGEIREDAIHEIVVLKLFYRSAL